MDRLNRAAVVTPLAGELRAAGSWCGETHIQKAVYLLQSLVEVPTGFLFVLYKHAPFSFDLSDELTSLRGDQLLTLEVQGVHAMIGCWEKVGSSTRNVCSGGSAPWPSPVSEQSRIGNRNTAAVAGYLTTGPFRVEAWVGLKTTS